MTALTQIPWTELTFAAAVFAVVLMFYILYRAAERSKRALIMSNLEQLNLLRMLLADFQRHRGLSTGLISGDQSLREDLTRVRARIDQSIEQAQKLDTRHPNDWKALIAQWRALRADQNRDADGNMQAHHQLIRDTIFLIEDIASEVDLSCGRDELSYLICIWHEVVQTAEWSGQARALGTGIAASRSSSAAQRVRLRFLHQKITHLSRAAFGTLQSSFASKERLLHCQRAVDGFLHCIEQELLGIDNPSIEAKRYFDQATGAINELLALVDAALNELHQLHGKQR
ncbi:MAG: hypothetical protein GYB21_08025 [Oceanospirillales bacterium]|nr:hypothetical protein [Oceanospirillales bacterium]